MVGETQIPTVEAAPPVGRTRPGLLLRRGVREVIGVIIPAILAALLIQVFVAQTTRVESYSMEPTLYERQRLVIEKISYHLHAPRRGDIVVLHAPDGGDIALIKRVIGLPGETIEVRNGQVLINGHPLQEPYLRTLTNGVFPLTPIPDDAIFVMGDNRDRSRDSRTFGPVPIEDVVGRAWLRYWPPDRAGFVLNP